MKGQLSPHSVRTQYTLYIQSNFLLRASRAAFFIDFAQPCKYTGYTQSTLSPKAQNYYIIYHLFILFKMR